MYISMYKQMCVYIPLRDQPCYKFSFEPGPLILYSSVPQRYSKSGAVAVMETNSLMYSSPVS